jgi:hypothetical protein
LGFALLLWKRPLSAVFLPLAGIAAASFVLGARFTVFSASFFGLGLGCGLVLTLHHFQVSTRWRWAVIIVLTPLVFWFVHKPITHFKPDAVLGARHAQALYQVGQMADARAMVWNWWDLGHASLFYTQRAVVERADNSFWYARAMSNGTTKDLRDRLFSRGKREHYVVVSWEKLGGVENLLATGTFNSKTGKSARQGQIQKLTGGFEFDLNQGFLIAPGGRVPLRRLDIIEENGPRRLAWPWHEQGNHAVFNQIERTGYLMDPNISEMMYVRMLLGPPEELRPEFELVVDDFPWVRVYRAN